MQVLHVCSEMFPLLKTGGLADVIARCLRHKLRMVLMFAFCFQGFPISVGGYPTRMW